VPFHLQSKSGLEKDDKAWSGSKRKQRGGRQRGIIRGGGAYGEGRKSTRRPRPLVQTKRLGGGARGGVGMEKQKGGGGKYKREGV